MSVSLTFRCPDDLAAVINSQVEATGQDKTSVVVGMLRSTLPSLPLIEKNKLPEIPAIYIVWLSNSLLYIGKTSGLRTRFSSHHRMVDFLASGDNVWIAWFPIDSQDSPLLEANLIELLEPELNSVLPGKKTNVFSFRLPDKAVQVLESRRLEDETLNQAAQRVLLEALNVNATVNATVNADLSTNVDNRLEVVESALVEVRSQLEELRGKLKAR